MIGRLVLRQPPVEFPTDVTRLRLAAEDYGYTISERDAEAAWCRYSEDHAAGWLTMTGNTNAELVAVLLRYCALTHD